MYDPGEVKQISNPEVIAIVVPKNIRYPAQISTNRIEITRELTDGKHYFYRIDKDDKPIELNSEHFNDFIEVIEELYNKENQ